MASSTYKTYLLITIRIDKRKMSSTFIQSYRSSSRTIFLQSLNCTFLKASASPKNQFQFTIVEEVLGRYMNGALENVESALEL